MTTTKRAAPLAVATVLAGFVALSGTLAAPVAHADTVDNIKATINSDRAKTACAPYKYSPLLETVAQAVTLNKPLPVYNGEARTFYGRGDPVAAAVNSAYVEGFGPFISECRYTEFGVTFYRNNDRLQDQDKVTIVIGIPGAPAPVAAPPAAPADPPASKPIKPIGRLGTPARATADVDLYKAPGGADKDRLNKFLKKDDVVRVLKPCTPDD
jgi:hypothetical protein